MIKPKTILIVEDDENILFALSTFLDGEGCTVLTASNGLLALDLLSQHGMPDLILLDMLMPVMNGWQFAAAVREKYSKIAPIIVISAAADVEQRAKEVGATAWIGKPFNLDDLLVIIKKIV